MKEIITIALQKAPLFNGIKSEKLDGIIKKFIRLGKLKEYEKNGVIITEKEKEDGICFVITGGAFAYTSHDGKEIVFNDFVPGQFFGEMAIIDKLPRSASVGASSSLTKILRIKGSVFKDLLFLYPEIMFNLLVILSSKIRKTTTQVADFALEGAYKRIREIFTIYANGELQLSESERFNQEYIAKKANCSRPVVSMYISYLKTKGHLLITSEKKYIIHGDELPEKIPYSVVATKK